MSTAPTPPGEHDTLNGERTPEAFLAAFQGVPARTLAKALMYTSTGSTVFREANKRLMAQCWCDAKYHPHLQRVTLEMIRTTIAKMRAHPLMYQ